MVDGAYVLLSLKPQISVSGDGLLTYPEWITYSIIIVFFSAYVMPILHIGLGFYGREKLASEKGPRYTSHSFKIVLFHMKIVYGLSVFIFEVLALGLRLVLIYYSLRFAYLLMTKNVVSVLWLAYRGVIV